ncbi:hypothetical protein HJC23_004018 [Cyclotella cryptica]|uniref:Tubulin-specific chaperone D n=1 Tax=Cyclotella cryptica TaxID=29204 RepID=A0ABD3QVW6_9STRA|eukprot:CCRYP_002023-RA/>CCRYP_002023-RA protein AED:0.01 eAED:0.01 QI:197/1/1/1/1/1/5/101/1406
MSSLPMPPTTNTATFESSFFTEHDEVLNLISIISSTSHPSLELTSDNPATALSKFRTIFDKYLECPTLLDPFLEGMVQKLSLPARKIIHEVFFSQHGMDGEEATGCNIDEIGIQNQRVEQFERLMHLLSAIYALSKVRGRKYIQRLMPHEASDVEPVLAMLRWFGCLASHVKAQSSGGAGRKNECAIPKLPMEMQTFQKKLIQQQQKDENSAEDAKIWESIYSLLNWLGIISLVPFDLHTIDSSLESEATHSMSSSQQSGGSMTLVQSILSTSVSHLNDSGPTREAAAACLASLLSRPDLEQSELEGFVIWSAQVMYWFRTGNCSSNDEFCRSHSNGDELASNTNISSTMLPMSSNPPSVFLIMGILQTLAAIFKSGHRSNLLSTQQKLNGIELLWEQCILVAEGSIGSMLLRKLLVKLFARIGCAYLPPRVAAWRYHRGRRSLLENLMNSGVPVATGQSENVASDKETSQDGNELFLIPDQVEDAMGQLLLSLTDPSTIVRWSSAKGIGRLTERLPAVCADDVLDAILQTCSDPERDRNWHGACLCLAELARRGLLLPNRLKEVVPIVVQAIGYDVRRGQHSIGAHVRDAACYTCWAFARAYSPEVLRPHVKELSEALVLTSLFDREVNCRRAASAAFQESVGRQGADNFKHGIEILTAADYFSLGNRVDAYLNIALMIAKFDEYQKPIIHHLSNVKLHHWDIDIRTLASQSLAKASKLDPLYCANEILPQLLKLCFNDDLVVRHGSLLGAAEMVLALGELKLVQDDTTFNEDLKSSIAELIPSIEKARLYRGRGGEIMRSAACRMIECISLAGVPLTVKQQVRLLDSVDTCLAHPNEEIQSGAAKALNALLSNYFPVSSNGPSERLQSRVVDKYILIVKTEDNPAATRGFSLALGSLPSKLLAPSERVLDSVLNCLCDASRRSSLVGGEGDAETRRNAITSLVNVCKTVGIRYTPDGKNRGVETAPVTPLTKHQALRVFDTLLDAMDDYNTDRRGDVGSWSRIAAMNGLETLAFLTVKSSQAHPHSAQQTQLISQSPTQKEILVPSFVERLSSFSTMATQNPPYESAIIFNESLCYSILSALLKQFGEKLDAVRSQAGLCIERLLTNDSPRLPFVPCRHMLIRALNLNGQPKNWSNPALTFPLLMCAVNIEGFQEPILSGIVISVGGLTESVSKSSSAALFEWIRELRNAKAIPQIYQMGEVFLGLFRRNKRNGRVLLPLLATLDKLLTHGYLDELLDMRNGEFSDSLLSSLSDDATGCTDVKRLLAIVDVSINLLQPHLQTIGSVKEKVLPFVMSMLLNPYPRVRRFVAEQLFAKLTVDGESMFDDHSRLEEANQLLLNVVWHDEHDASGHILASRNRIADLLGIPLELEERNKSLTKKNNSHFFVPRDEFENYSSLVNSSTA